MATGFKFSELNADGSLEKPRADYQPIAQVAELSAVDIDFEEDEPRDAPSAGKKNSAFAPPLSPVTLPFAVDDSDILQDILPPQSVKVRNSHATRANRAEKISADPAEIILNENFSSRAAEFPEASAGENYAAVRDPAAENRDSSASPTSSAATVRQVNRRPLFADAPETDSNEATVAMIDNSAPAPKRWWQKIGDFIGGLRARRTSAATETPLDLEQSAQLNLKSNLDALNQPPPSAWRSRLFGWFKGWFRRGAAKPPKNNNRAQALAPNYNEYPTLQINNSDATQSNSDFEDLDLPPQPASENDWLIPEEALAAAENSILRSLVDRVDYSDTAAQNVEIFSALDEGKKTASFANTSLREKVKFALNKVKNMSGSLFVKKKI